MLVPVENEDHSFRQVKAGTSHEPVLSFAFRAGHISGYFAAVNPKHHLVQAVGAAREGERQDYGRQHPACRQHNPVHAALAFNSFSMNHPSLQILPFGMRRRHGVVQVRVQLLEEPDVSPSPAPGFHHDVPEHRPVHRPRA